MNQMYYWMINSQGCKCAWISPIYKQAKKVYEEMVQAFEGTGLIKTNATDLTISLGKSTLQFFSAERYDNIRGFTFDYEVCDEFAFMDEEAWTKVLRATVLVKGKKVLLISTPKGKNHFWKISNLESVNPQYKSFTMTSYNNPLINPSEINDAKLTLPDHVFRQEYMAEFIDGGTSPFKEWKEDTSAQITARTYAGIDLGRADDYTVISVRNDKGHQIYVNRWRHDTWSSIIGKLKEVIDRFNCHTFVEVNSMGDPIYEQLQKAVNNRNLLSPFYTNAKTKQDIIEQLIVANQNDSITLQPVDWLKKGI